MVRLHTGIIVFCLLSALACTTHAEVGTVRLLEERILFTDPATSTGKPDQFVKVICHGDDNNLSATITTDPVYPLARVPAGETLTILDVVPCEYTRGGYAQARNQNNITGYTLLPNYDTHIKTTDAEAAYKVLYLIAPSCIQTHYADPECRINAYAEPLARYTRLYPHSPRVPKVAEKAATQYKYAADTFQYLANNPAGNPAMSSYYATRYTRTELLAKAKEFRKLEQQMQVLANQKPAQPPAPQQTAATQPTARPAEPSKPVQQTTAPPQPAPQQTVAAQPTSLNDPPIQPAKQPEPSKPAPQTAALQQAVPPPQTPSAPVATPSTAQEPSPSVFLLFLLIVVCYPIAYWLLCISVVRFTPRIRDVAILGVESLACFLVTALIYALTRSVVMLALLLTGYACIRLFVELGRVATRRDNQKAEELKAQVETQNAINAALRPLLNHLHKTYGRYIDMPDCIPATWYEPRKQYIEYIADLLYTYDHSQQNAFESRKFGIAADSHPLKKLRFLPFPRYEFQPADLQDSRHPCNVIKRAITDPTDRNHMIFHDLIPANVDLLPYLTEERWRQPLERQAQELEHLVMQEITKLQYVIIGTPPNRDQYPLPVFYRDQRFRHTYVIGKTGSGKSTLLRNLIAQDIHYGNGLIVLSPENDLFERLLAFIPPERKDDLIYFDPTDTKPPIIGFNPLALEAGEDLTQKAGETMTALKRALGDLGVTMEPLIQNAVYALLQRRQSTFADLARLIDPFDAKLRTTIKNDPNIDETTRTFWQRYERSTYYQKSHEAVINRLMPFFRPPISTILATPSLSFKTELNEDRRIIFLNLSRLRGMEAATIGQLILAEIQQSLLVRDELPEDSRIPYYLYIDEFQTYAGDSEQSLINILNGARKYKLGITLAHQTTSDIPSKLLSTIVGNVGTVISLQLAAEDAPFFARELQIRRDGKDSYSPEALQNLSTGYGYARTPNYSHGVYIAVPSKPVVALPDPIPTDELKSASKKNFGLMPETEPQEPDTDDILVFPRDFDPPTPIAEPPPARRAEEPDTATAVLPLEADAPVAEASAVAEPEPIEAPAKRKRSAAPRQARKPVVRKTIKKKSVIPEETIEIE